MKNSDKPMRNILVVEDNTDIANLVAMHLKDLDASVKIAETGTKGLHDIQNGDYDLVILDIMLPGMDGIELCRQVRQQENYTPILMLTSKSSELDRVVGLEVGADDYLTKPFSVRELVARAKALFRRVETLKKQYSSSPEAPSTIHTGDLVIYTNKRQVTLNDETVELTAREFDLLWHFVQRPGQVFTRSQLLDSVWGYGHDGYEHTVNSHINRLRAKIEADPSKPKYILTVWGVGYQFNDKLGSRLKAPTFGEQYK